MMSSGRWLRWTRAWYWFQFKKISEHQDNSAKGGIGKVRSLGGGSKDGLSRRERTKWTQHGGTTNNTKHLKFIRLEYCHCQTVHHDWLHNILIHYRNENDYIIIAIQCFFNIAAFVVMLWLCADAPHHPSTPIHPPNRVYGLYQRCTGRSHTSIEVSCEENPRKPREHILACYCTRADPLGLKAQDMAPSEHN